MPDRPEYSPINSADELGLNRRLTGAAILGSGLLPAGTALLLGAGFETVAAVFAGGAVTAVCFAFLALRHFTRSVVTPLDQMTRALDEFRCGKMFQHVEEQGAPLMLAMMRRFNQACETIAEREQMSRANLLSVEAAFDRVHSVLQSLREGVVVIDDDGRVVMANRSARQVIKHSERPVEGQRIVEMVTGDVSEAVTRAMKSIDDAVAEEVKATDLGQDGRIFDMNLVKVRSNRPDRDFGKVLVLVDVTKNHEINQLKDELLSSISHELRTPLTNLCSSSEILAQLSPQDDVEWREFVDIIGLESHRLKGLINDVMEYTKIETGQIDWTLEPVDMNGVAERSIQVIQEAASQRDIDLMTSLVCDKSMAMVDSLWIHQVMVRLLDNAVKFTPGGGAVRITVDGHEDLIEVSIADSGEGVPTEDRDRVFERFTQLGDMMTEKPKGAGLGLPICQRVVDAMGGTLWCEESDLGGAQFRFVLPGAVAPAAAD